MSISLPETAINAEPAPLPMQPAVSDQLAALFVNYSERVEAFALATLRKVAPTLDAGDVAAEVWLTLSELAAAEGLPSVGAWDLLRQTVVTVITATQPASICEIPAALRPLHPAAPWLARIEQLADAAARPTLIGATR